MAYHKTRDFNRLKDEWYAKLKDEGFDDIEHGLESTPYLKGVRGTSTILDNAKDGWGVMQARSEDMFREGAEYLAGSHERQSVREEIANRCLGRMSTECWLTTVYLAHNIPERTIAEELRRSRVWVRQTAVAYRIACDTYAKGGLWDEVENTLQLAPLLPSDFKDL